MSILRRNSSWGALRVTSSIASAAFAGAVLFGCASTTPEAKGPVSSTTTSQDEIIDLSSKPLHGSVWMPEAMGLPPMVLIGGRAKMTLDKARASYAKASAKQKQLEAQYLATELYEASKTADDSKLLLDEARTVLRTQGGDKLGGLDENSKKMLLSFDYQVGDYEAALAAARALPPVEGRQWEVDALIKLGRIDEAAALPAKASLSKGKPAPDVIARDAYLGAWIAWRQGKSAEAVGAIELAAKNWERRYGAEVFDTETMVILARNGAAPADAVELFSMYKGAEQQAALEKLAVAYERAGRMADAAVVLDSLVSFGEDKALAARFKQFVYALGGNGVDGIVAAAKQLQVAAAACVSAKTPCSPKAMDEAATEVKNVGTFLHAAFVSAHDVRYADAADALYDLYPQFPDRKDLEQVVGYKKTLAESRPRLPVGKGTHSKEMMGPLFAIRTQELLACYDRVLLTEPKVTGDIAAEFDISDKGTMAAVRTTPAAGDAGLGRVAGCIRDAATAWTFPTRSLPGTTTIKLNLSFVTK